MIKLWTGEFWAVVLLIAIWGGLILWVSWGNIVNVLLTCAVKALGERVPGTKVKLHVQADLFGDA